VAEKTVLETYVRETTELLNLTINGEVIKTTFEHPFYVKDVGFVEAGKLQVGDKLVDSRGNVLVLEGKKLEITDKPVKVTILRSIIFIRIMLVMMEYWSIMQTITLEINAESLIELNLV